MIFLVNIKLPDTVSHVGSRKQMWTLENQMFIRHALVIYSCGRAGMKQDQEKEKGKLIQSYNCLD